MKAKIATVAIAFLLFSSSTLFSQEDITITTYYPSPSGSYRDLRSVTVQLVSNTLTEADMIQTNPNPAYRCTNTTTIPPTHNPACAGLMIYDSGDSAIKYFDGTKWVSLFGSIGGDDFEIGGYSQGVDIIYDEPAQAWVFFARSLVIDCLSANTACENKTELLKYGTGIRRSELRPLQYPTPVQPDAAFRVNIQNFPRANYSARWSGVIDVDQYWTITAIHKRVPPSNRWKIVPDNNDEYNAIYNYAISNDFQDSFYSVALSGGLLQLLHFVDNAWRLHDATEIFTDTAAKNFGPVPSWNADTSSSHAYSRSVLFRWGRPGNTESWRPFHTRARKYPSLRNQRVDLEFVYQGTLTTYRLSYNVNVAIRLRNMRTTIFCDSG